MLLSIRKRLREEITKVVGLITESDDTVHLLDRVATRVHSMTDVDLKPQERQKLLQNLEKVKAQNFPTNKSYAIMLGRFTPNPQSPLYMEYGGQGYYRIMAFSKDSTGDQIWVVIRNNNTTTLMLRKSGQDPNIKGKLDVDVVIKDISTFNFNQQGAKGKKGKMSRAERWAAKNA